MDINEKLKYISWNIFSHNIIELQLHLCYWWIQWTAIRSCGKIRLYAQQLGISGSDEAKEVHACFLYHKHVKMLK